MANRISNIFKKIGGSKNVLFTVLSSFLFLLSFSLCFVSGMFNPEIKTEESAEYIADVVEKHTEKRKYAALLVDPKDSKKLNLIDTGKELYDLYAVFGKSIASFAGTINADHTQEVHFKDIETNNLSFLYTSESFGSKPYHNRYIHEYYPLELMFNTELDKKVWQQENSDSLICISETQANKLLDSEGLDHTSINYKNLVKRRIILTVNGQEKEWQIENIFYEENSFFEAVKECAGEFVFTFSRKGYPEGLVKQSLYFLSNYPFRNSFYFNYVTTLYPQSDFNYKFNYYNFVDDYRINMNDICFSIESESSFVSTLCVILGFLIIISNFAIIYFFIPELKWWQHIIFFMFALVPYFGFKLTYIATHKLLFFTSFGARMNLIMIISCIIVYAVVLLLKKRKSYENK